MKYHIISATRSLGLLPVLDRMTFLHKSAKAARGNRAFLASRPDFAVPPADLAFDAYNKVDWADYHDMGLRHAGLFARLIRERLPAHPAPAILEWGCGPGRLIRHMAALMPDRAPRIVGTDYNPATIDWCRDHLPDIEFALNGLAPPLPFPDNSFDATYNFSVFTHLSEEMHEAWARELYRVLKPGGMMIATTHGDHYRYLLTRRDEADAYDSGRIVTQRRFREGKKWFFAIHPPAYVRNTLLAGFKQVEQVPPDAAADMTQDVWLGFKPHD
ncbi:class I SAM-dependent methyltransferase [Sphingobium cloacae]|uniref:Putative methyltransferase type 11 n=1 Tax=Sphingobium cloacae TaxID=120107 RepID=A0A1E1F361_9SPHN|nr:class I SAM-dependent methyltransferase [Sphingobium cloacae]BAV64963.1 putative methyltransferase type 11 [Sphingobium cloacae]